MYAVSSINYLLQTIAKPLITLLFGHHTRHVSDHDFQELFFLFISPENQLSICHGGLYYIAAAAISRTLFLKKKVRHA